ncbi:MAG TPA: ATP-dependent DNA helicase [Patescibacteria group bacterium]
MANFQDVYSQLNDAQKRAVDTIDGPVMVIAGPGTGKTQVLAARIANILKQTDTNPSSILALTFTESAAKNMRQRLVQMIGKTGYYVQITTFHAFCSGVIQTHPEFFAIDRDSSPLTDLERFSFFEEILLQSPLEILKPLNAPLFYLRDVMRAISDLKREGVTVSAFEQLVQTSQTELTDRIEAGKGEGLKIGKLEIEREQKKIAKWRELAKVYEAYQLKLGDTHRYDFDDMIALVMQGFQQHELLLREYQENLLYFLVDEYQDTNTAQNIIVDLLTSFWGEAANIFVVGDPNQAIYRFQGASVENALSFMDRYPNAQLVTLDIGYRCPPTIYAAASQVIENNQLTDTVGASSASVGAGLFDLLSRPLKSIKADGELVKIYEAPSQTVELIYVAESIQKLLKSGIPAEEIAVLYRHNHDANELLEVLEKWNLSYEIEGGDNILNEEHIRQWLTFLGVIAAVKRGQEPADLYQVMLYQWVGVPNLLAMKLARTAGRSGVGLSELIAGGYHFFQEKSLAKDVTQIEFQVAENFLQQLQEWAVKDTQLIFVTWFEQVLKESGYLNWILEQPTKTEMLINVTSLFREVKAMVNRSHHLKIQDFLEVIATMQAHGIVIHPEDFNIKENAVHLSTVHKAKGREWQHVFLIHVVDGKWGNTQTRNLLPLPEHLLAHTRLDKKEQNEDDRRLFYVALTRAKKSITLSYPQTIISENRSREVVGSMFLEEVKSENAESQKLFQEVKTQDLHLKADEYMERLLMPVQAQSMDTSEKEFFKSLTSNLKLSVTALNTYLRDPQEFIDNVLLRIPRSKPEPMAFGTAIHFALEQLYTIYQKTNVFPTLEQLLQFYEESLKKELLTSQDFDRRLAYGQEVLTAYYQQLTPDSKPPVFVERFFGTGWSRTYLDDIPLTGRIDRVDWLDTAQKTVRVIDYKTGKHKSEKMIQGLIESANLSARERELPESIRGPYKRQLIFYKLLTELDPTFIPTVEEAVFEFVEPDKKSGKIISRRFNISNQEVDDLKKLIKEVMTEIRELKFLTASS